MATFTVTTTADVVNAGDGVLSLREAVAQANAAGAPDSIRFAGGLDGRTVTLTQGQLTLTADVAIDGGTEDGAAGVTISGGDASRVFLIGGRGTDASLADLGISDGRTSSGAGGGVSLGPGSTLVVDNCEVSGNMAVRGGGIYAGAGSRLTVRDSSIAKNDTVSDTLGSRHGAGLLAVDEATVTIIGSSFTTNRASSYGGAISVEGGSSLSMWRSQVADNLCAGMYGVDYGGGGVNIENSSARITASAIVDNRAASGAGIRVQEGDLVLIQSTVAGNRAENRYGGGEGGGITEFGSGFVSLQNCTVTDNAASPAYEGSNGGVTGTGLRIANSIIAGNFAAGRDEDFSRIRIASDVGGTIAYSNGHNIFGSDLAGIAASDLESIAPARLFAALSPEDGGGVAADNGGPTWTVALRNALGNPALSGGDPVLAGGFDQRGEPLPLPGDSNPDIGAFELRQTVVSRAASGNNDLLDGSPSAGTLAGRAGADVLTGRAGNDRLSGESGGDVLLGGTGNDVLDGGTGSDTASYRDAASMVTVSLATQSSSGALGADRLFRVENLEGSKFSDRLEGDVLANSLGGGSGLDRLFGRRGEDFLLGERGDDFLNGGLDADQLSGGGGRDLFDFDTLGDSAPGAGNRDVVRDFASGSDRIDLVTIDARAGTTGNDVFTFLRAEGAAFTAAGQVRWFQDGGDTFIEADANTARGADLQIELAGLHDLTARDFVL